MAGRKGSFHLTAKAGRYPDGYGNGLSSSKTVSIFVTSTEALLASVTVPAGTDGDLRDGVFRYTALAESITSTSGVSYTLAGSPTGTDRIWDRTSTSGLLFWEVSVCSSLLWFGAVGALG